MADMHPEIEWHQAQGLPHGGLYHGLDEVRRNIFDPLDEQWWDEFTADPDEFLDAGSEIVVVVGRYRGVAKGTGKQLDVPFVHIWTVEAGQGNPLPPVPRYGRLGERARDLIIDISPGSGRHARRCFCRSPRRRYERPTPKRRRRTL